MTPLDTKLQLKEGMALSVEHAPYDLPSEAQVADSKKADAVLLFVNNQVQLEERVHVLSEAAKRGAMVWLAYPKAGKLGTDLNRDIIHDLMPTHGLDAVRQIAIDETWSALRFKSLT